MPLWRMAPPNRCFQRQARSMNSLRAGEHRADGTAQAFAQVDPDGVARLRVFARRDSRCDGCVEEPRAVHVCRESALMRETAHHAKLIERPDRPAAVVVSLLDTEQARDSAIRSESRQRFLDIRRRESSAIAVDRFGGHGAQDRRPAKLGSIHMREPLAQDRVAGIRVRLHRDRVAHRRRWARTPPPLCPASARPSAEARWSKDPRVVARHRRARPSWRVAWRRWAW